MRVTEHKTAEGGPVPPPGCIFVLRKRGTSGMGSDFLPAGAEKDLVRIRVRYRVRELAVFGSAARGELRPDSDVDLLVVMQQRGSDCLRWDACSASWPAYSDGRWIWFRETVSSPH